jgi:hypothetical protein
MKETLFRVTFIDEHILLIREMSPLRANILASADRMKRGECFEVSTVTNMETGAPYEIFYEIKLKR